MIPWPADLVKELRQTWSELYDKDTFMKGFLKSIVIIFFVVCLVSAVNYTIKTYKNKPANWIGIVHNGIEAETVIKYKDSIVYIRDTTTQVGRDKYDINGSPTINNHNK